MRARILAVAAVVVAAAALVAVKATRQHAAEAAVVASAVTPSSILSSNVPASTSGKVVLVADPREADTECGCGQIIRRVREAKARGIDVVELGPGDPGVARYGVRVAPTVLVLGADGRVVARREGESNETIAAISSDLTALEGEKR